MLTLESAQWGQVTVQKTDVELLSELTRLPYRECIQRLVHYRVDGLAKEWESRSPATPSEIRAFYAQTDNYLWELLGWNGSDAYRFYLDLLENIKARWPPSRYPHVLDYGSGVGSSALWLARAGYHVTIADVPGLTLEFARQRLSRQGYHVDVVEIRDDCPVLPHDAWHIVTCFDVLEHVPKPDKVAESLTKALVPHGGAAIVASFADGTTHPQHLSEGIRRFGGHRWNLYFQGLGMKAIENAIYEKTPRRQALYRRCRYLIWRLTGIHLSRLPR